MWLESLPDCDRSVFVLAKAYEDRRRSCGQFGYNVFRKNGDEILQEPAFKAFKTVLGWLASHGLKVTWRELAWQGYIKFVFEHFDPNIPHPGQFKNIVLLKNYLSSAGELAPPPPPRSMDEMERIYQRVLHPYIRSQPELQEVLGVRRANQR